MIEPINYNRELSRWVIAATRHSMHVEYLVQELARRGYVTEDSQRPHDLIGPGNKFETNVILGLSLGYVSARFAEGLKGRLLETHPEYQHLNGLHNGQLRTALFETPLPKADPLFNDLMYFRALEYRMQQAIGRHNTLQHHHQVWNGDKTTGDDRQLLFSATDAYASKREHRSYQGGILTLDEIEAGIKIEPQVNKRMALSTVFEVARDIEQPPLELIVDPRDFPNLGMEKGLYLKMRELAARAQDKVELQCKTLLIKPPL